jgi:hypothetical protein
LPSPRRFAVRLGPRSALILRLFGVRGQETAYVELSDIELVARFGWWEARTPVANIASWRIEGPWRWITAIGVRWSIRHHDLSFGGSHRGGVRLDFRQPIKVGRLHPPALYVSVEDLGGLAAALGALGIPGEDARSGSARG